MPLSSRQDYVIIDLIQQAVRNIKAQPLNLGGFGGPGGGTGTPPGGFIGRLPQYEVAYDETEAATLDTLPSGLTGASGWSLVDNLNHIRYRIQTLESGGSIIVEDWDGNPSVNPTNRIIFSGAIVTDLGDGDVLVAVGSGGGGGSPLTVEELDGSSSVSSVDKIKFNGAIVTDLGGGDVQVDAAPQYAWFRFNPSDETLEFGADVIGKEVNSGKIGYESFGAGYLHIVGAGTSPDRRAKLYDKTYCDLFVGGIQIPGMTSAAILGTDASNNIIDNTSAIDERYAPYTGWTSVSSTWTYASADDPIYQIYVSGDASNHSDYKLGNKIKCTNNSTTVYGFIVKVGSYDSGNNRTPVDIYCGTDYDIANSAITVPFISKIKNPDGFPLDDNKWSVIFTDTGNRTQTPVTTSDWYNLGGLFIDIPIGLWRTNYKVLQRVARSASTATNQYTTLSTVDDGEDDPDFTTLVTLGGASGNLLMVATQVCLPKTLSLTSKTRYYLNARTTQGADSIAHRGDAGTTVIRAICAYL